LEPRKHQRLAATLPTRFTNRILSWAPKYDAVTSISPHAGIGKIEQIPSQGMLADVATMGR